MKGLGFLAKLKLEKKLELVEPSLEISKSYSIKSGNCQKSAKILFNSGIYENAITESYYSMYNYVLSLFFRCGIKCENHTASVLLLDSLFNLKDQKKLLSKAKKERIDSQYYLTSADNSPSTKETAQKMITDSEKFVIDLRLYIDKLNSSEIEKIRDKFSALN